MRRIAMACLAAGLVGLAVPVPAAQAEPAFGGFSTEASATPFKIEIYEPVIPIPSSPQLELELAYTRVESASGPIGKGLASWLWPGDAIGQGFKTFVEQLGLPPELGARGYPIQVNSETPGAQNKQSDEPLPGMLMQTESSAKQVTSVVGFSTNDDVSDNPGTAPSLPGMPQLPGLPPLPGLDGLGTDPLAGLTQLGDAITGQRTAASESPAEGLPPELAALVDVDGLVSFSKVETVGDSVKATATSKMGNIFLLGGLLTIDSMVTTTTSVADGRSKPKVTAVSKLAGVKLAGQELAFDKDGVLVGGKRAPIIGLPQDPAKALAKLGLAIEMPTATREVSKESGEAVVEGLRLTIDTKPLRQLLDVIPLGDLVNQIPAEAGQLKNLLGAVTQLAPKIVVTVGNASTEVATVPKMEFDLPSLDPGDLAGAGGPATGGDGTSGTTGSGTGTAPTAAGADAVPAAADAAAAGAGEQALAAQNMSSGLPPLASIPGALLAGAIILAAGIGWWLQKIGGLVLGGAGSCTHGLETGVPDLRRA